MSEQKISYSFEYEGFWIYITQLETSLFKRYRWEWLLCYDKTIGKPIGTGKSYFRRGAELDAEATAWDQFDDSSIRSKIFS